MNQDFYLTIAGAAEAALKIKGSRFLAFAAPVAERAEAEAFVDELRRRYFDATHHCFAWRLGSGPGEHSRFADDGEPSGTAGKPILQVITGRELTNLIVVVVRYFGGTKLGTGGLVRAYAESAALVLEGAPVEKIWHTQSLAFAVGYDHLNAVMKLIERHAAAIEEADYGEEVSMRLGLRLQEAEPFRTAAVDLTHGTIRWKE
ncbi:MAG TPA: YigZ family protein [bacterium]|nr:YigZ family protein [bacterium]HPR86904.1 YigZ family protein [bacterium]